MLRNRQEKDNLETDIKEMSQRILELERELDGADEESEEGDPEDDSEDSFDET